MANGGGAHDGVATLTRLLPGTSLIRGLVGLSLLLLIIVQAAGFAVVRASIDRNASRQVARAPGPGRNIWRRLLDQNAEQLRQARPCWRRTTGFGRRSTRATRKPSSRCSKTMGSALRRSRDGAAGHRPHAARAVSLTAAWTSFILVTLQQVVPQLAQQPQGSQIAVMEGIPYQFVMVPMRAPVVIGWVLMGFRIDQSRADEMRQLLSVHVALMVRADGARG